MKNKASSICLTVLASAGVAGAIFTSVKATPKALKLIEEAEKEKKEPLTKKEIVKTTWKCYIPTASLALSTIICIAGLGVLNQTTSKGISTAYALLSNTHTAYRSKVKEKFGLETDEQIMNEITVEMSKPVQIWSCGVVGNESLDIKSMDPEIERTFYDSYSQRYFTSTLSDVIIGDYHFNRNYVNRGYGTVNELYDFWGVEEIDGGDTLGWCCYDFDFLWVDFNHHITTLEDGMEVCVIDMVFTPTEINEDYM